MVSTFGQFHVSYFNKKKDSSAFFFLLASSSLIVSPISLDAVVNLPCYMLYVPHLPYCSTI
jgi:hypothetical protein